MTAGTLASGIGWATEESRRQHGSERRERDARAVAACQRGERDAFDELVERYQRDIYWLCYRYVGEHGDAADLAQESFIKAYRAIGRFRGKSSFSTWLYRIAVNTCLNHRAARRPTSDELPEQVVDGASSALARLESEERSRQVRQAVERLPERQRATLILKVYHELTHREVAEILDSSVGTVKANLFHALANLRRQLGGAESEQRARGDDGERRIE
jgi:RNA polymerase sigma-70 factor (ECF subfamily)